MVSSRLGCANVKQGSDSANCEHNRVHNGAGARVLRLAQAEWREPRRACNGVQASSERLVPHVMVLSLGCTAIVRDGSCDLCAVAMRVEHACLEDVVELDHVGRLEVQQVAVVLHLARQGKARQVT